MMRKCDQLIKNFDVLKNLCQLSVRVKKAAFKQTENKSKFSRYDMINGRLC